MPMYPFMWVWNCYTKSTHLPMYESCESDTPIRSQPRPPMYDSCDCETVVGCFHCWQTQCASNLSMKRLYGGNHFWQCVNHVRVKLLYDGNHFWQCVIHLRVKLIYDGNHFWQCVIHLRVKLMYDVSTHGSLRITCEWNCCTMLALMAVCESCASDTDVRC